MNSLQRYFATLKGERPDFPPRVPILMQFAAEYIGSNYAAFASDYRVLVEANLRCASDFGMDQLSAISDPYRETAGFGAGIAFERDSVPRCVRPPLADSMDLRNLQTPDPMRSPRMLDRVEAIRAFRERAAGEYSIMGWIEGPAAEAADLRGVQQFVIDLIEHERFAGELMDVCVEVGIDFARAQIAAGADTIGIGDAIASTLSPRLYAEFVQPREKRLVNAIQEMGAFVRLHICGNITHLLPGIADARPDILDVDSMVDLRRARQAMGPRVVLSGNVNPVSGVRFSTPAAIRRAIEECYAAAGFPYMVNAGCEIPAGTPIENLQALCEPILPAP
jgi:MtaA/CmuA family methyltransferase